MRNGSQKQCGNVASDTVSLVRCERLGESYVRSVHACGLTVLVCQKPMHAVSAVLSVDFGAQDTRFSVEEGRFCRYPEGVAHYLEHQLFTREDGGTVDEEFSSMGADVNAWTNHERTVYTLTATDCCERALELLVHFVTHPAFSESSVQKEQGIITQEIRMVEDDPWERLHRRTMRTLYPHHAVSRGICGTERSVARISPETLYDCYHAFYRPEHMCLSVCGNITLQKVMTAVDRACADLACDGGRLLLRGTDGGYDKRLPVLSYRHGSANVSKPIFQIAWRDDDLPHDPHERLVRDVYMDVISELLFSRAGTFFNRLIDHGLITPTYAYGYTSMMNAAYHSVSGESTCPQQVLRIYRELLEDFRKNGFSREDVERNRRVAYAGFIADFDDTEDIADLLAEAECEHIGAFDRLSVIDMLQYDRIQELFRSTLSMDHTTLTVLYPYEFSNREDGEFYD